MATTVIRGSQVQDGAGGIDLTTDVTGTLPTPNGGTNVTSAGAAGNILASNGANWVSAAPAPNITPVASSATPSVTVTGNDQLNITTLAVPLTGITVTGSPQSGWKLIVRVTDNGTSRAFAPGASFQNSDNATAPTATTPGKTHILGYIYDEAKTKYVLVAVNSY